MRDLRNRLRVLAVFCAAGKRKVVTADPVAVNSFAATMHQVHVSQQDSSCWVGHGVAASVDGDDDSMLCNEAYVEFFGSFLGSREVQLALELRAVRYP